MVKKIHWTPQLVNKFWDGVAQTKLDDLSFGKVAGSQFLDLISNYLVPGGSCLDFGAGGGHVLQLLLDRGMSVAGFDPSPERQAQLLARIGQHKNFLGVKGFDSIEQFDVVLLMEVVEHVLDDDFDSVLERAAQFVKPGGYLIASTPNNENLEYSSVYCPVSDTFFHPWQHVRSFIPTQLANCFNDLGFSTEFMVLADFSYDAERIESHKKFIESHNRLIESHEKLSGAHKKLIGSHNRLIESHEKLSGAYKKLIESHNRLIESHEKLYGAYKKLIESHNRLIESHEKLSGAHKKLIGSHKELTEVYMDACNEVAHIESSRAFSLKQFSETIELLAEKYHQQHKEFKQIDDSLRSVATLGFWQKIKFRFNLLLQHRALIARLQSISQGFSQNIEHSFDEVSGYTVKQLKYTIALKPKPLPYIYNSSFLADDVNFSTQVVDDANFSTQVVDDANFSTQVVDDVNFSTHVIDDVNFSTQVVDDVNFSTHVIDGIDLQIGKETTIVYVGRKR